MDVIPLRKSLRDTSSPWPKFRLCNHFVHQPSEKEEDNVPESARVAVVLLENSPEIAQSKKKHASNILDRWYVSYIASDGFYFRELDAMTEDYASDPIVSIRFNVRPTCQCLRRTPTGPANTLIAIGFCNGTIVVYNPFQEVIEVAQHNVHLNERGEIDSSAAVDLQWLPDTRWSQFCAVMGQEEQEAAQQGQSNRVLVAMKNGKVLALDIRLTQQGPLSSTLQPLGEKVLLQLNPSQQSNPLAIWHFGSSITAMALSVDERWMGITNTVGEVLVFDFGQHKVIACLSAFYGALKCLAWSDDSKLIVTGGEDDLVCVWDPFNRRLLARGQGHTSWVSTVCFLPRQSQKIYKFSSAGQDGLILFWEYKRTRRVEVPTEASGAGTDRVKYILPLASNLIHQMGIASLCSSFTVSRKRHNAKQWRMHAEKKAGKSNQEGSAERVENEQRLLSENAEMDFVVTLCNANHLKFWAKGPEAQEDTETGT